MLFSFMTSKFVCKDTSKLLNAHTHYTIMGINHSLETNPTFTIETSS
jgi:hypothetical protein